MIDAGKIAASSATRTAVNEPLLLIRSHEILAKQGNKFPKELLWGRLSSLSAPLRQFIPYTPPPCQRRVRPLSPQRAQNWMHKHRGPSSQEAAHEVVSGYSGGRDRIVQVEDEDVYNIEVPRDGEVDK